MTTTVTLAEAESTLRELINGLRAGDEVVIVDQSRAVARLVGETRPAKPRTAGSARGKLRILIEDDEHLKDFAEYVP